MKRCVRPDLCRRLSNGRLRLDKQALSSPPPERQKKTMVTFVSDVADSAAPGLICYLIWVQVWTGVWLTCCCSSLNLQGDAFKIFPRTRQT